MAMKWFSRLYQRVIDWSAHKNASWYLAGVSVIESSVFPIPPDTILIPMVLSRPERAWRFASIATIASVFGGMLGYLIGFYAIDTIGMPILEFLGYESQFHSLADWFERWGVVMVLLAGVTPIPYKVFTIGAGALHMPFLSFCLASLVGRSIRFFFVSAVIKVFHQKLDAAAVRHIDKLGWIFLILLILPYIVLKFV